MSDTRWSEMWCLILELWTPISENTWYGWQLESWLPDIAVIPISDKQISEIKTRYRGWDTTISEIARYQELRYREIPYIRVDKNPDVTRQVSMPVAPLLVRTFTGKFTGAQCATWCPMNIPHARARHLKIRHTAMDKNDHNDKDPTYCNSHCYCYCVVLLFIVNDIGSIIVYSISL